MPTSSSALRPLVQGYHDAEELPETPWLAQRLLLPLRRATKSSQRNGRWRTVRPRILIVEDDAHNREGLRDLFLDGGYMVETCGDALQGFRLFRSFPFDIALVDLDPPAVLEVPISGWDFLRVLRAYLPELPVVVLTAAEQTRKMREDAAALRVAVVLHKPISPGQLKSVVGALAIKKTQALIGSKDLQSRCW